MAAESTESTTPDPLTGAHLIACGHGTRSPEGQRVMERLVRTIEERRGAPVHGASVDVQEPEVGDVAAELVADRPGVIVPLLLSAGFHTEVDLRKAADRYGQSAGGALPMTVAAPLGPSAELARLLRRRLLESGWAPGDPVVLGVAGSSRPSGRADAERQQELLRRELDQDVVVAFGAAARPSVAEAVAGLRAKQTAGKARPIACASYLLAPGNFQDRLLAAGADRVAAPLLREDDPEGLRVVADLALARAREALTTS